MKKVNIGLKKACIIHLNKGNSEKWMYVYTHTRTDTHSGEMIMAQLVVALSWLFLLTVLFNSKLMMGMGIEEY